MSESDARFCLHPALPCLHQQPHLLRKDSEEQEQPGYARTRSSFSCSRMVNVTTRVAKQSITAACWSLLQCSCRLGTSNSSSSDNMFWINLPLRRSLHQTIDEHSSAFTRAPVNMNPLSSGVPRGGLGCSTPPPPKF